MEPNTGGYLPSLVEILILVYTKPVDKQQQKQKQQKRGILFGQIARLSWTACSRARPFTGGPSLELCMKV